nr:MAG TPA: hypothetical protein [Caudoviricetes sp.]
MQTLYHVKLILKEKLVIFDINSHFKIKNYTYSIMRLAHYINL